MEGKYFILLLSFILISCNNEQASSGSVDDRKDGIVKTYDEAGHLKTVVSYRKGLKHGKSLLYYEGSDQVMLEMNYENGKRSGIATKYFESGKIYAKTPYENDEVNGVVKLFFRNGKMKAEVPYNFSKPGIGLREYYTNGELKTEMPKITYTKHKVDGSYFYYFSIQGCNNANYFVGALLNNKYLIAEPPFVEVLPKRNNEGIFKYTKAQLGQTINIICKCETSANNPYVTRQVIELGK